MCNHNKTQVSPYDATKLAIHLILRPEANLMSNCCHISKKRFSFHDIVHFIDDMNIVTYVDFFLVLLSTLKLQQKSDRSTEKKKHLQTL